MDRRTDRRTGLRQQYRALHYMESHDKNNHAQQKLFSIHISHQVFKMSPVKDVVTPLLCSSALLMRSWHMFTYWLRGSHPLSCCAATSPHSILEFCTGAGAVKSRGKTAGVPREREERPPFIPRECWERDCLLRESRGTGSKGRSPPAPAGVTLGSLVAYCYYCSACVYHYRCIYHASDFQYSFDNFLNEYVS